MKIPAVFYDVDKFRLILPVYCAMISELQQKYGDFMNETDLRKLYYQDIELYQAAFSKRFHADTSIKPDFRIGENQAFFTQSDTLVRTMYSILRLDRDIMSLCYHLPGIALRQYSRKCLIDEIVLTNEIEGIHSSRKEIGEALSVLESQSERKNKRIRFIGMVNKYLRLSQSERISLQTCEDVRKLYDELILDEVLAENKNHMPDGKIFRKDQTELTSPAGKVIHSGVMPESRIIHMMSEALRFLNDDSMEPLYRICAFHYMMEYIHPFYDGNGRLGRFIVSDRIAGILNPLLACRLSQTIQENIRQYYDAFRVCNDFRNMGEITPFMTMMLSMIEKAGTDLKRSLEEKIITWKRYEELLKHDEFPGMSEQMFPVYNMLIQAALFSETGISTGELQDNLGVSYGTVRKRLANVRNHSLLVREMRGRENFYRIDIQQMDKLLLHML